MSIESMGAKLLSEIAPALRRTAKPRAAVVKAMEGDLLALDREAIAGLSRDAVSLIAKFDAALRQHAPDALKLKYRNMAISPRRFLTGQPALMTHDLRELTTKLGADTVVQGDMHLHNFGIIHNLKGKLKVRPIDFDEALIGPAALDFNRLATHTVLTGREHELGAKETRKLVERLAGAYHDTMSQLAQGAKVKVEKPAAIEELLKRAKQTDAAAWIERRAPKEGGKRMLEREAGTRLSVSKELSEKVARAVENYKGGLNQATREELAGYQVTDVVKVVQGTGSMGRPRYRALLERGKDEPIILQLKAQELSPMQRVGLGGPSFRRESERSLAIGDLMDGGLDPYRGVAKARGLEGDFLVERVRAADDFLNVKELGKHPKDFAQVLAFYGAQAAKGHARGAEAGLAGAREILKTLGERQKFVDGLVEFSHKYADQTERDFAAFVKALERKPLLV